MRTALAAALVLIVLTGAVATPVWTISDGLASPESVYYDATSGFIFSSQINGDAAAKDGNGRIAKLTLDGKMVDASWVTGLNAPKGSRAYRGTLWVVDIDEVVGIEIATGKIIARVTTDARFLNDIAVAADGALYASDSFQNRIYVIRNGVASVFVESDSLLLPNGVIIDGNRLVVGTDGRPGRGGGGTPGSLWAVDLTTKALTQVTTQPVGTPDGVELDGRGGFIVADVGGARIFHVGATGESKAIRDVAPQPADISFITDRKLLIVPHLGPNRISAYDLTGE